MSDEMGTFRTDVEIANPARPLTRELIEKALVDTGTALSWFPASLLESLGITRLKELHFRQADGTILSRWTGAVVVYVGDTITHDEVVFGEPGDLVLLGARSLEGLNLCVDPVRMQLVDAGPAPVGVAA
jgi:predicted aspartyl protease